MNTAPKPPPTHRLGLIAAGSLFAGLLAALVVTAGAAVWMPHGAAGIDHLIVPIVCFPITWIVLALLLYAAPHRRRAWLLVGGITLGHALLILRELSS